MNLVRQTQLNNFFGGFFGIAVCSEMQTAQAVVCIHKAVTLNVHTTPHG
ncbi:hypothetical protein [Lacticaseibacillus paracasei]|nr:hypothetical protein [Lacticaseibacillus paracasei]CAQ65890.1 Putative uncharacterized protein [Lacticaseibacillus paracasei]